MVTISAIQDSRMMSVALLLNAYSPMAHKCSFIQRIVQRVKYYFRQLTRGCMD